MAVSLIGLKGDSISAPLESDAVNLGSLRIVQEPFYFPSAWLSLVFNPLKCEATNVRLESSELNILMLMSKSLLANECSGVLEHWFRILKIKTSQKKICFKELMRPVCQIVCFSPMTSRCNASRFLRMEYLNVGISPLPVLRRVNYIFSNSFLNQPKRPSLFY